MRKIVSIIAALVLMVPAMGWAQGSTRGENTATVQPRIMVIPYYKQGQDIATIVESNTNLRVALAKIKEAFDSRGFTTVDFMARLRSASANSAMQDGAQTDIKTQIISTSGADIYVEAEVNFESGGAGNSVVIILTGYEVSSGNSLANKVGRSGNYNTSDYGKLATLAVESIAEDFMAVLQDKFTDIVRNGRSLQIEVAIGGDSDMDMYSEVGTAGNALADEIESWLAENAFQGYYHIQGVSDKGMIVDEVKIPIRDIETGANYTPSRFASQFIKFLKQLNLTATRTTRNQTLLFTIN